MPINWIQVENYEAMSSIAAERTFAAIERGIGRKRPMLLGLATGNTMLSLYERLAAMLNRRGFDLSQLHTVNLDEYVGADGKWIPSDHPLSYRGYVQKNFFHRLDPKPVSYTHLTLPTIYSV